MFVCVLVAQLCLSLSLVQFSATPWIVARQTPLSMGFSRQEYWSGLLFPLPGDLPNPGTEPAFLVSPALAGGYFTTSTTWKAINYDKVYQTLALCIQGDLKEERGYSWSGGYSWRGEDRWNSPVKNTGVGCHALLQEIFLTQGLNLGLLLCRQILYHLSHQRSPDNTFYWGKELWEFPLMEGSGDFAEMSEI